MIWPFKRRAPLSVVELKRIDEKEILLRLSDGRWVRCRQAFAKLGSDFWCMYWEESGVEIADPFELGLIIGYLRKESWRQEALARQKAE